MRFFFFILFFTVSIAHSQTTDNKVYFKAIHKRLEIFYGTALDSVKSIIVINGSKHSKQDDSELSGMISIIEDYPSSASVSLLYNFSGGDSKFLDKLKTYGGIKQSMLDLIENFTYPKIETELLLPNNFGIKVYEISESKFDSFFGKNYRSIKKGWKRIENKYNTHSVFKLSKISYNGSYASVFLSHHCGGLCGSGDIYVLENIKGEWEVVGIINFFRN